MKQTPVQYTTMYSLKHYLLCFLLSLCCIRLWYSWCYVFICPVLSATELQAKHEHKMSALRDELELRRKTEIHEIEEVSASVSLVPSMQSSGWCPVNEDNENAIITSFGLCFVCF